MFQSQSCSLLALAAALVLVDAGLASADMIDSTTSGNWIGVYGSQGYILPSYGLSAGTATSPASTSVDTASLPSYVSSYSYGSGFYQYVWDTGNGSDARYPQNPANPSGPRNAATAADYANGTITLNLNHSENFQLAVYGLDWDNYGGGRNVTVSVGSASLTLDPANGYHTTGTYAVFNVNALAGPLVISIANNNGSSNSAISGIFFANGVATPEPSSLVLCGLGAVGLFVAARRRRKA